MAQTEQHTPIFSGVAQPTRETGAKPIPTFLTVRELRGRPGDEVDPRLVVIPVTDIRRVTINENYETVLYLGSDAGGRHSDVIRVDDPFENFEKVLQAFDLASEGYPEHGNHAPRRVTSREIEIMRAANEGKKD